MSDLVSPSLLRQVWGRLTARAETPYDGDAFTARDDAIDHLLHCVYSLEQALARVYCTPETRMPQIIVQAHEDRLSWACRRIMRLNPSFLPYKITLSVTAVQQTAPDLATLPAMYPFVYRPTPTKKFCRGIIFHFNHPPTHSRIRVANVHSFIPTDYPAPDSSTACNALSWTDYKYFCTKSQDYISIKPSQSIDLFCSGRILIFRPAEMSKGDCLNLEEWEQLALESAVDDESELSLATDASSPLPPSSPPPPSSAELWEQLDSNGYISLPSSATLEQTLEHDNAPSPTTAALQSVSSSKRKTESSSPVEQDNKRQKLNDSKDEIVTVSGSSE
ncbi:hypothetical protein C8R46DRAFT_1220637 [Mycena filopes]|nr:hypothetical protein C8R46DRAFT_1220637 [Mycena filopes]